MALILTFSTASVLAPTVADQSGIRTFKGTFLAAYTRDGRNLAPRGASEITFDLRNRAATVVH